MSGVVGSVNDTQPPVAEPPISFSDVLQVVGRLVGECVRLEVLGGGRSGGGLVLNHFGVLAEPVLLGASPKRLLLLDVGGVALVVSESWIRGAWRLWQRGLALPLGSVEVEVEPLD